MNRRAACAATRGAALATLLAAATALLLPTAALAHTGGTSYLSLMRAGAAWQAQLDLPLPDATSELALDADGDAALRWGEVLDAAPRIEAQLARRLRLRTDAGDCAGRLAAEPALVRREHGPHLRVALRFDCGAPGSGSTVLDATSWLAAVPDHAILVDARAAGTDATLLAGSVSSLPLAPGSASAMAGTAGRFFRLGVEHLLTGYDHLAFLALLLLGAMRGAGASPRAAAVAVLRVVTAFTLAHSVTLGLAAAGVLRVPSAPVEAAIAASIVATALGLLLSRDWVPHWRLAFAIGLVHGLGFAGLLGELLEGRQLALPLAAFNVGLEFGQLTVVLAALPTLAWLARRPAWQSRLVPALSLGLGACGLAWLAERL